MARAISQRGVLSSRERLVALYERAAQDLSAGDRGIWWVTSRWRSFLSRRGPFGHVVRSSSA
jgi:hypothetical protein